jgi:hypothetical protein
MLFAYSRNTSSRSTRARDRDVGIGHLQLDGSGR